MSEDPRRQSPAVQRNSAPISDVFRDHMPISGTILEIASGTGEHGLYLTQTFPDLTWTYSDIDPAALASQAGWREHAGHDRLRGPIEIDVTEPDWPNGIATPDAMFSANMIHISQREAGQGLFLGAGRLLKPGGRLMVYGPFSQQGEMSESNQRFDEDLRRRNGAWGIRDLQADILPWADAAGLSLTAICEMPANNLSLIFERV